ncbi:helix-turn-helix domain-containing protein [Chryseobacterium sp. Bi04]|uniref:helix-turn-helix domain-containing protein n=1 Tax=Chryseobacterium sp. Bi04 TaxID=2822345 RepID=UPI001E64BCE7|nr:helix-turn-helix domain-containing protein [Chryseobacterium sp. Bi04]
MKKKYYKGLYLQEIKKQEIQNSFHRPETILHSEENIFELTDINPLIVESILHSLETFEKEKKYLDKNASLSNLAKECATNTSYMSKVVNHYKKQNFASYLNDLRLNHATELWRKNPKLRYKSIQGMADMTGFNTAQSFSKKFNEKYKISPTHFLKNLNQNIKKS